LGKGEEIWWPLNPDFEEKSKLKNTKYYSKNSGTW
jgi:hypothetical protein